MTEKLLLASKFRPKRLQLEQAKTCPSWEWAFQPLGLCAVWFESWMCRLCSHQGLARESLPAACKQSQNKSFAKWNSQTSIWTQHSPAEIHLWWKLVLLHATVWDTLFSAKHGWSIHLPGFCPHLRPQHLLCVAQAIFGQHDLRSQSSCFWPTEHNHEAHCEAFRSKLPHLDPLGAPMCFSTYICYGLLWQPLVFRWKKQPDATSSQKKPLHAAPWELCCGTCQEWTYYPWPSTIARRLGCQTSAAWGHGQGNKISFLAVQGLCVLAGGECICLGLCWSPHSKNFSSWYAVFARD